MDWMTCEDYDERNGTSIVEKAARRMARLLTSRWIGALARALPRDIRQAIVTVLVTAVNVLRK